MIIGVVVTIRLSYCVKSVRIRSYSGPQFSRMRTEYREILRNTSPLNALTRRKRNLGQNKKKVLVGSCIYSNFDYCPLI